MKKTQEAEKEETKERLLKEARKEFFEKGFINASLRSICKNAGVTTGALYFFFKNKEALFSALVDDFTKKFNEIMENHLEKENFLLNEHIKSFETKAFIKKEEVLDVFTLSKSSMTNEDADAMSSFFDLFYNNYDLMILLLQKAQGTKYENFIDEIIEKSEKHTQRLCKTICKFLETEETKPFLIHWYVHMLIETYLSVVLHIKEKSDVLKYMPQISKSLQAAFAALFV